ncbi:tetratricopeptide repeat protein [Pseudomonas sp. B22129]|uniref:tetratricopeptide repeat protein n=1 Tax=Pseudomonas sp. B22129 TaxID=3235111 RepID=UPI003784B7C8
MSTDDILAEQQHLARLMAFLGHDPGNPTLLCDAMSLAIALGDQAIGQRLIEHVKIHGIEDPRVFAHGAHLLLQAGDYLAAAALGDQAITAGLSDPAVVFNTALGHFYSADFSAADTLLSHLTRHADCPAGTLLMHARALHQLEETEPAEALALRAQQREPGNQDIRGLLALLLYENDKLAQALNTAHETLAADPDQRDALIACATVQFEQYNVAASRKAWLHTLKAYPDCGRAWSGLGLLEFSELDFDLAETHLKTAVQFMPHHIGTWHLLAWIYILRKDNVQARAALEKSYALDRSFGDTHGGLAVVDIMEGHSENARKGIRRALRLKPDSLSAHYAQALLLQQAGQMEEARQLISGLLEKNRPGGEVTGRTLVNQWLQRHQQGTTPPNPGQH